MFSNFLQSLFSPLTILNLALTWAQSTIKNPKSVAAERPVLIQLYVTLGQIIAATDPGEAPPVPPVGQH